MLRLPRSCILDLCACFFFMVRHAQQLTLFHFCKEVLFTPSGCACHTVDFRTSINMVELQVINSSAHHAFAAEHLSRKLQPRGSILGHIGPPPKTDRFKLHISHVHSLPDPVYHVGIAGFEPTAFRSQSGRSTQAELHPGVLAPPSCPKVSRSGPAPSSYQNGGSGGSPLSPSTGGTGTAAGAAATGIGMDGMVGPDGTGTGAGVGRMVSPPNA